MLRRCDRQAALPRVGLAGGEEGKQNNRQQANMARKPRMIESEWAPNLGSAASAHMIAEIISIYTNVNSAGWWRGPADRAPTNSRDQAESSYM